jgi:hypothetical protein
MSWDAILTKTADPNFKKPAENADSISMGQPAAIRDILNKSVQGLHWNSQMEGHVDVDSFSVEFSLIGMSTDADRGVPPKRLSEGDDVGGVAVTVRGDGNPVPWLVSLATKHQWSLVDSQEGEWIDLDKPNQESWEGFTGLRDHALGIAQAKDSQEGDSIAVNLLLSVVLFMAIGFAYRRWLR